MEFVLAPSNPVIFPGPVAYRAGPMAATGRGHTVEALDRLASVGAMVFTVAIPLVGLLAFAAIDEPFARHFVEALVATALYLPLHVRHVRYGLKGLRPRGLPWTLLAMAVVLIAFTPVLGAFWLFAFSALAASVLVTTRPRFSFPA